MYNGSLAHRKVWPASRACAESNCMDISLNKVRAGVFLVRDRPDTRLVVFLRNKPNKVLRVRQPGCVHEFCQRLGLRSALRASLFQFDQDVPVVCTMSEQTSLNLHTNHPASQCPLNTNAGLNVVSALQEVSQP